MKPTPKRHDRVIDRSSLPPLATPCPGRPRAATTRRRPSAPVAVPGGLRRRFPGSRRFTLIELLIVIAIIALLAGMLLQALAMAKRRGHRVTCINNLKQLTLAFELYAQEWDDQFPEYHHGGDPSSGNRAEGGWVWYDNFTPGGHADFDVTRGTVYRYVNSAELYRCPSDATDNLCSYGANCNTDHLPRSQVMKPAETCLLLEEGTGVPTSNDGYFNANLTFADAVVRRHNNGCVYGFCDGHVAWHKWANETAWQHCKLDQTAP